MIQHLEIRNFKSIEQVELDCHKVNVIIGEPNSGKSNILEAMSLGALFSAPSLLEQLVRFENLTNIFRENDLSKTIAFVRNDSNGYTFSFENNRLVLRPYDVDRLFKVKLPYELSGAPYQVEDVKNELQKAQNLSGNIKFYRFSDENISVNVAGTSLFFPNGSNLASLLLGDASLKNMVSRVLEDIGHKLLLKPVERKLEIVREREGVFYAYPYETLSDTLKRVIFYLIAVHSNSNSILLFEEPEANTFPFYTQQLAEAIVDDESNQFFIVTHNPYFLQTLVEKTPLSDLMVNITYMEDYKTKVKQLKSESEISKLIDFGTSSFFNFDHFIGL